MLNQFRFHAGQFRASFTKVDFTGSDVESFLQNQSTFDVALLKERSFHLISFLDPQGRVESYGWLLKSSDTFSYLIPNLLIERSLVRLNKFLISEDVTISDPLSIEINIVLGPEAHKFKSPDSFQGELFEEEAYYDFSALKNDLAVISSEDVETWRGLNGWPSFDGSDFSSQIINNLRLYDLCVVNKGCYPGQETVSKIATRRGAAYSPVLIEVPELLSAGEIISFEKKIGSAHKTFLWNNKKYLSADLLRDFRVLGMKIHFTLNSKDYDGVVGYYPLLSGDPKEKALELFYEGADHFRVDELSLAEEKFRLAIKLDPGLADAYESLGVMLGRQERFQEAIELMQELSVVDPKSVLAHTNMSLYLMRLGKIDEAEEQKSQATLKSFQKFGDEAKNKEVEENQKKAKTAEWVQRESMFKQVLEIDPDDTLANYGLGSIAVEKGDWELARTHLERVLKQDPKYSVAYLALGRAYKGLGLIEEARKTWKEGITVSASKGDLMPANQMQAELER